MKRLLLGLCVLFGLIVPATAVEVHVSFVNVGPLQYDIPTGMTNLVDAVFGCNANSKIAMQVLGAKEIYDNQISLEYNDSVLETWGYTLLTTDPGWFSTNTLTAGDDGNMWALRVALLNVTIGSPSDCVASYINESDIPGSQFSHFYDIAVIDEPIVFASEGWNNVWVPGSLAFPCVIPVVVGDGVQGIAPYCYGEWFSTISGIDPCFQCDDPETAGALAAVFNGSVVLSPTDDDGFWDVAPGDYYPSWWKELNSLGDPTGEPNINASTHVVHRNFEYGYIEIDLTTFNITVAITT